MAGLEGLHNWFEPGDGCTLFIDGIGSTNWRHCCDVHDIAYQDGLPKMDADLALFQCVSDAGAPLIAIVMFLAVVIFGGLFWNKSRKRRR